MFRFGVLILATYLVSCLHLSQQRSALTANDGSGFCYDWKGERVAEGELFEPTRHDLCVTCRCTSAVFWQLDHSSSTPEEVHDWMLSHPRAFSCSSPMCGSPSCPVKWDPVQDTRYPRSVLAPGKCCKSICFPVNDEPDSCFDWEGNQVAEGALFQPRVDEHCLTCRCEAAVFWQFDPSSSVTPEQQIKANLRNLQCSIAGCLAPNCPGPSVPIPGKCCEYACTTPPISLPLCDSRVESTVACESSTLRLQCEQGSKINIVSANYGRTDTSTCPCTYTGCNTNNSCRSQTSVNQVRAWCDGMGSCNVPVSNKEFGDPCSWIYKYLQVEYRCVPPQCV